MKITTNEPRTELLNTITSYSRLNPEGRVTYYTITTNYRAALSAAAARHRYAPPVPPKASPKVS